MAALEAELAQAGRLPELAQMVALVKQKAARCQELEGALREAVRQTEDREAALHDEAEKHAELTQKVGQTRLKSHSGSARRASAAVTLNQLLLATGKGNSHRSVESLLKNWLIASTKAISHSHVVFSNHLFRPYRHALSFSI